jgi:2-keto-4-pentenoate hydratase/2-oxohepta-3-ene-1,7-dioic acid hydratase in catechol pathway
MNGMGKTERNVMENTLRWLHGDRGIAVGKILCVGQNYVEHIEELGSVPAGHPLFFTKPPSSLVAEPDPIVLPAWTGDVHHEVELALVIAKRCKHLQPADCDGVIGGYALALDLTARDVQQVAKSKGHPWAVAKGFDTACPVSGVLPFTTIDDLQDVRLRLWVDDEPRHDGSTSWMIYDIPRLLCDASRFMTLEPGDLLLTGTPKGVARLDAGTRVRASLADGEGDRLAMGFDVRADEPATSIG